MTDGAVYLDETAETFAFLPDRCPTCVDASDPAYQRGGPHEHYGWRYDTGCGAPGCAAASYDCCGTGCDTGLPNSRCDAAYAAEPPENRLARENKQRAVFGLSPLAEESA